MREQVRGLVPLQRFQILVGFGESEVLEGFVQLVSVKLVRVKGQLPECATCIMFHLIIRATEMLITIQ